LNWTNRAQPGSALVMSAARSAEAVYRRKVRMARLSFRDQDLLDAVSTAIARDRQMRDGDPAMKGRSTRIASAH